MKLGGGTRVAMFYLGLDLGQRHDLSAIAVVERRDRARAYQAAVFDSMAVRRLERVPLGTPYPQVVARVKAMVQHPAIQGQCVLAVDATGVGAPVVDLLRAARLGCEIVAVTITGGTQAHIHTGPGGGIAGVNWWSVPKRDLMAGIDVLLARGELTDCAGREGSGDAGAGTDGYPGDDAGQGAGADGRGRVRGT